MTGNAPDPEAPSTWLLIAGDIAIGLFVIAIGSIVVAAILGIVACPKEECVTGHLQHALAVLGTVTAAFASVKQGETAKAKSDRHRKLSTKGNDETLKGAHKVVADHFKKVSGWWYAFFGGAIAAVVAEFIDWWW
jgi:hypothetical protein